MTPTFLSAFERLIGHEGGFQKMPKDDGNWTGGRQNVGLLKGTKFGISAAAYPKLDIERLTLDDARRIYWTDYWLRTRCDRLPGQAAFHVFDAAVHHGPGNAVRFMQRALDVLDDGRWGPITERIFARALLDSPAALIARFNGQRLEFMTRSARWEEFARGWARRVAANLIAVH